jgi:hypothetical protein
MSIELSESLLTNRDDFTSLTETLRDSKVLILTNRDIMNHPRMHGEDSYIYGLYTRLKVHRIEVDVALTVLGKPALVRASQANRVGSLPSLGDYDVIVLHNVSPLWAIRERVKLNTRLLMPVYFLWNKDFHAVGNLRVAIGTWLWQCRVNGFIVASTQIGTTMKRRGVTRKIYFIPPTYACPYCDITKNSEKHLRLTSRLPDRIIVVYIGSIGTRRFHYMSIMNYFYSHPGKKYEFHVYTAALARDATFVHDNVTVNIHQRILSEREKCEVLSQSHMFVAPASGTTMEPPISVIEARHHGNLILREKHGRQTTN